MRRKLEKRWVEHRDLIDLMKLMVSIIQCLDVKMWFNNGHYFLISTQVALVPHVGCILVSFLQLNFKFVPKRRRV